MYIYVKNAKGTVFFAKKVFALYAIKDIISIKVSVTKTNAPQKLI